MIHVYNDWLLIDWSINQSINRIIIKDVDEHKQKFSYTKQVV